jgi:hypothetical protein
LASPSGQDFAENGILLRSVTWNPPELLFPCADRKGRGIYGGLHEREPCGACGGRGCVPARQLCCRIVLDTAAAHYNHRMCGRHTQLPRGRARNIQSESGNVGVS